MFNYAVINIGVKISFGPDAAEYQDKGLPQTSAANTEEELLKIRIKSLIKTTTELGTVDFAETSGDKGVYAKGMKKGGQWDIHYLGTTTVPEKMSDEELLRAIGSSLFVILPDDNALEKEKKRADAKKAADARTSQNERKAREQFDKKESALRDDILKHVPERAKEEVREALKKLGNHITTPYVVDFDDEGTTQSVTVVRSGDVRLASAVTKVARRNAGEIVPAKPVELSTRAQRNRVVDSSNGCTLLAANEVSVV